MPRGRGKRRNYFVKRWILEALANQTSPVTARATLDIIKVNQAKKDTSRRTPNISAIKLGAIMSRMKEIANRAGGNTSQPLVYWLKGDDTNQHGRHIKEK